MLKGKQQQSLFKQRHGTAKRPQRDLGLLNVANALFIGAAILSLNVTMFAVAVQMGVLVIDSAEAKVVSWVVAAASWHLAYRLYKKL